jgi:hypothetical protein
MDIVYKERDKGIPVGDLRGGTLIRGAPGHPEVLYMVLSCTGLGLTMHVDEDLTPLVNLNYGGIRAIPSCTPVEVYEGKLHASPLPYNLPPVDYMTKEAIKRNF